METDGIAIITGVLSLPRIGHAEADDARTGVTPTAERILSLIEEADAAFARRAQGGDAVAAAVASLSPGWSEVELSDLQRAVAAEVETGAAPKMIDETKAGDLLPRILYHAAAASVRDGEIHKAAAILAALLHHDTHEADALVGLAICGARLRKFDDALVLAAECMKLPAKHPRAYCIAGFCELERGHRKVAQSHLAMAARMARRRPEFRDDLRTAQRLLLILHYA